ncbi:DUF5658 family protein [Lysinibacillus sp. 3P01SB]|uniref:DUF5658 family protein n=1 Tax=Lysinibacillus sp. 3P01SB TaxID=3132284 RepID=UPI0039A430CF
MKLIGLSCIIAVLNVFDGLATHYGLKNALIIEANPIMDFLWKNSPSLFLLAKIGLSALILYVSLHILKKSGAAFRKLYTFLLAGVSGLYAGILCLHIVWIFSL